MGAEDHVDVGGPLADLLPVHLGQAAAHGDLHVGPALPQRLQVAQMAVELVVGVLPDAAGVEHHDVGGLEVGRGHQAVGHQDPGQPLGVVLVHLAAEGPDVEGTHRTAGRAGVRRLGARRGVGGGHGPRIRPPRWSGRPVLPDRPRLLLGAEVEQFGRTGAVEDQPVHVGMQDQDLAGHVGLLQGGDGGGLDGMGLGAVADPEQ